MINALVVEDEEDIRLLLAEQLKDKGCRVRTATNGSAALQRIRMQAPDIVFIDIMMPVMDGINLISELQDDRDIGDIGDIPVVLVTAVSTPDITLRAIELGVKYRLAKPWEQSQLDYVFEQALNLGSSGSGLPTPSS